MLESTDDERAPRDDDKETADASWLTSEGAPAPASPAPPASPQVAADEGYDVVGRDDDTETEPAAPVPPVPAPPVRAAEPRPKRDAESASRPERAPQATVDRVWSRWGEWGADIIRIAAVAAGLLVVLYLAFAAGAYSFAFLLFLAGIVALGVLGYPLFVTLERPVRIVPEQALSDFYAALSHALPHYRRMWLLLSSAGRTSARFSTLEGFRAYWIETIAALAGPSAGKLNPLTFSIAEFQSERSSGLTEVDVKFTLNVFRRNQPNQPLATFPMTMGLVKGPDRMWYLNRGTIPTAHGTGDASA